MKTASENQNELSDILKPTEAQVQEEQASLTEGFYNEELASFTFLIDKYPRSNTIISAEESVTPYKTEVGVDSSIAVRETTEREGLVELASFLRDVFNSDALEPELRKTAKDMLESLVFVGEEELSRACEGLSAYYKGFLDEDPENVIVLTSEISDESLTKSDVYVLERILQNFSDAELESLDSRIILGVEGLNTAPAKTKIVVSDDRMITGSQVEDALLSLAHKVPAQYLPSLEVNLVTATQEDFDNGIPLFEESWMKHMGDEYQPLVTVPIKAHFKIPGAKTRNHMVTGAHSASDMGFETPISAMVEALNDLDPDNPTYMPALTNISRPYRNLDPVRMKKLKA